MQQPKFPSIVHHKARDADVVFLRGPDGKRRQIYLGRHGSHKARHRYREVMAAHLAGEDPEPRAPPTQAAAHSTYPTIAQLAAEYTLWAERELLDASTGKVSREVVNFDHAIDHILERHRDVPTYQFALRDLQQVRQAMSQRARDERNASKASSVGDHYGIDAYRKAIHRAYDTAGVERWSPHRLHHAKGTELARKEGIEVARIALGHKDDRVTRRYAVGAELDLAIGVARKHG